MNVNKITDKDLDDILASVSATLAKAESQALSKNLAKEDEKPEDQPAPPAEAAPGEEPPPEAPPAEEPPAEAPPSEEPPQEAPPGEAPPAEEPPAAPAEQGEEQLEHEDDQPLSDEELDQIYGSMEPEELERHYMAVRKFLEQHMGGGDEQPAEQSPEAPEAPPAEMPQEPEMGKSEDVKNLEAKLAANEQELKKTQELAMKAIEMLSQPARKAVTGVEFIKKNEELEGEKKDFSNLSKADIDAKIREIGAASLSKSEREAVNNFMLYGESKNKVLDIIKSKGGK